MSYLKVCNQADDIIKTKLYGLHGIIEFADQKVKAISYQTGLSSKSVLPTLRARKQAYFRKLGNKARRLIQQDQLDLALKSSDADPEYAPKSAA